MDNTPNSSKQSVVIVGSGIGGLVCALILAKNGFSVTVLEKNNQIGGALQVFSRDKRIFDTGVHYIGGLDKGENLHQLFEYLGIYNDLQLSSLSRESFDVIRLMDGKEIPHGQGYENFKKGLIASFPTEIHAIEQFCTRIQEICTYFPLYNIEYEGEQTYYNSPEILAEGAWDYVSSLTSDHQLKIAFLGSGILYAGDAKSTPMYVVALIMNSFIKGSYRLKDGGSQLAKALVKQLRIHGGEVLKHKEVVHTEMHPDKKLKSVICSDGTRYEGDHFVFNLHPSKFIEVIGKENFIPAYVKRINNLKNTVSSFLVYITLKENVFPYLNSNFYDYFTEDGWNTVDYEENTWPQVVYSCTPLSSKSERFADTFVAMVYMSMDEVAQWSDSFNTVTNKNERDDAYEHFKRTKEAKVIEKLAHRFPLLKNAIKSVYSSTPLTFRDYLGTPEGELYGIEKNYTNPTGTIINSKTKIDNAYLTGQNIVFHGILGATIGAFVTSFNFVDNKRIIQEIKDHGK